jgi:hypothetical protein
MCRNIRTLFNFEPPATEEEIRAASLQFVRKISGFTRPSKANEAAFDQAVEQVAAIARSLLDSLETSAEPRIARSKRRAPARGRLRGSGRPDRRYSPRLTRGITSSAISAIERLASCGSTQSMPA